VLDHYLHTAARAALLLNPSKEPAVLAPPRPGTAPGQPADYPQALAWFEAEHQVLLAAVTLAAGSGFDSHAWQLPWAMEPFMRLRGHWQEWAAAQRTALAAATRLADTAAQALSGRLLGMACTNLGDHDQARGHYASSLTLALRLYQAIGAKASEAVTLNEIGWCHGLLGDYQQARPFCRQALTLCVETGDRRIEGHAWDSLGYAEHHLGDLAQAAACYQRALSIAREVGDRRLEASTLTHLGDTRHAAGELAQAREAWQQALAILDDWHHPDAEKVRAKLAAADS
jgi:tetratricopeptide (TPR) repeat protein